MVSMLRMGGYVLPRPCNGEEAEYRAGHHVIDSLRLYNTGP